jgi:hypothetical protein
MQDFFYWRVLGIAEPDQDRQGEKRWICQCGPTLRGESQRSVVLLRDFSKYFL